MNSEYRISNTEYRMSKWKVEHIVVLLTIMAAGVGLAVLGPQLVAEIEFNSTLEKAESGDADAMFLLARLYETGRFCEQDNVSADYWYREAMISPGLSVWIEEILEERKTQSISYGDG